MSIFGGQGYLGLGGIFGSFKGKLTDEQVKLLQRPGKMMVVKRTGWIEA